MKMHIRDEMLTYLIVTLIHLGMLNVVFAIGYGQFSGGSMSYVVEKTDVAGTYEVHINLITGWVLGKGPCGPSCSKSDIGKETMSTRAVVESQKHDPIYFGNWTTEDYKARTASIINDDIKSNATEKVLSISQSGKWEQEQMTVTVKESSHNDNVDIVYEGYSWRDLPLQRSSSHDDGKWHLQSKLDLRDRSDTGKPNASPMALVKPFYRVLLDSVTQITIPGTDSDGDYVKCKKGLHVEAGSLSNNVLPGLTVNENCTITINASSTLGYKNDLWGGIAVTMHDYNKEDITLKGRLQLANIFAIGGSTVQFLVQVLEHIYQPEFVNPTHPSNHRFYLYAGTTLNIGLYAKASENTSIAEFVVIASQHEVYNISEKYDDPTGREHVKCATVTWTPENSDKGEHIICVRAIDDSGVDTNVDRCFIIQVKDKMFHATNVSSIKPYFVDLPTFNETLECDIDATCVFPIYVHSPDKIVDIDVEVVYEVTKQGGITQVQHNGDLLYKMDLALMHNQDGPAELCLTAKDVNGAKSDRVCIRSEIIPADPCESGPCLNSGKCSRRENDTADYECKCINDIKFEGKNCEKKNFMTVTPIRVSMENVSSEDIDDCKVDSCNGHGICKDGVNDFTCSCYDRYNGTYCSGDLCPSEPDGQLSCNGASLPGCNPHPCGNGKCLSGGKCICPLAYRKDINCTTAKGDLGPYYAKVTIVPPTLADKSDIVCYKAQNCSIAVYLASPNSTSPTLSVEAHADIAQQVIVEQPTLWSGLPDIQNMFKSEVVVLANTEGHKYVCLTVSDGNSNERRCFSVTIKSDPAASTKSFEYKQKNRAIKFVDPTPKGDTRFVCFNGTQYHLLLYTSVSPNGSCDAIVPSEDDIKVFDPTTLTSGVCQTEVTLTFETLGSKHICFQSSPNTSASQLRCFDASVLNSDPCLNTPCQNNGECLYSDNILADIRCECRPGYKGDHCEHGQCQQIDNHCHNGYCQVNTHVTQCMCPIGYKGDLCEEYSPYTITNISNTGAKFTDTLPVGVMCIRNRPCSVPLIASGYYPGNEMPDIRPGYTSLSVDISDIDVKLRARGSYSVNVKLVGHLLGLYDACVLSMNKHGVNRDEVCLQVSVTDGMPKPEGDERSKEKMFCVGTTPFSEMSTRYNDKDMPHFIEASLPTNSNLICTVGEPCHLLFTATPGERYKNAECVTLRITPVFPVKYHVYSSCDTCAIGSPQQLACKFDVVFPFAGVDVCVEAMTTVTKVVGEKRCFKVKSHTTIGKRGCQLLHCENGGFCDGHLQPGICHCRRGFSGLSCQTDESLQSSSWKTRPFIGSSNGIPTDLTCYINKPCFVPYSTLDMGSDLTIGYLSPGVQVNSSMVIPGSSSSATQITSASPGKKIVCLQATQSSFVADEVCLTVDFAATGSPITHQIRPYFMPPTYPKDTTIMCKANTACHLDIHYTKGSVFGSTQDCPTLSETSSPAVDGIYIFPGKLNPSDCSSDISYIAPDVSTDTRLRLCVQVSLPGKRGERRCFILHIVKNITNEVVRPCAGKTCYNGGVCVGNLTVNQRVGNCVCLKGYTGIDCSQDLDACASSPCKNGGICETLPGTFHCYCAPGYDGRHCDHDYNECLYHPCKNGGTCYNMDNGFQCTCPTDFTGQTCETHTDCAVIDSYQCWQIAIFNVCEGHRPADACTKKRCEVCQSNFGESIIG